MPITLLKAWAWIKLNAVIVAIAAAVLLVAVGFSYMTGRAHGGDACEARYTKRDNTQLEKVIDFLEEDAKQTAALRKKWDAENAATDAAVEEKVVTIYQTLEKVVEVPVTVQGPCDVDYAGTARVFDNATSAAFDR